MNTQRINELATLAGLPIDAANVQKFAELIAKDHADICRYVGTAAACATSTAKGMAAAQTAMTCAKMIEGTYE